MIDLAFEGSCRTIRKYSSLVCHLFDLHRQLVTNLVDLTTSHLSEYAIQEVILKNGDFTNNAIEVEMSSGPHYDAIKLTAYEFLPLNLEFLTLDNVFLITSTSDQRQRFTPSYSLPIGLRGSIPKGLRSLCLEHIKSIIEQERHVGEVNEEEMSMISWSVFESVNRYRKSSQGSGNVSHSSQVSIYMS